MRSEHGIHESFSKRIEKARGRKASKEKRREHLNRIRIS